MKRNSNSEFIKEWLQSVQSFREKLNKNKTSKYSESTYQDFDTSADIQRTQPEDIAQVIPPLEFSIKNKIESFNSTNFRER